MFHLSKGWVGSAAYVCSALLVGGIKSAKCFSNEMLLLENTVSELAQKLSLSENSFFKIPS